MSDTKKSPEVWLSIHRRHGRGPWFDVRIGVWNIWRCSCGEKFHFSQMDREAAPDRYVI